MDTRKINGVLSMKIWVLGINVTKFTFGNNQRQIGNTHIKYSLMGFFTKNIIHSFIYKLYNNLIIVYNQKLWKLTTINFGISNLIWWVFDFWSGTRGYRCGESSSLYPPEWRHHHIPLEDFWRDHRLADKLSPTLGCLSGPGVWTPGMSW